MDRVDTHTEEMRTEKEVHGSETLPNSEHEEKQANGAALEHERTHDHDSDEHDKEYHLKKEHTLGVDIDNEFAVKGDDSDGKITWTPLQFVATICLAEGMSGRENGTTDKNGETAS